MSISKRMDRTPESKKSKNPQNQKSQEPQDLRSFLELLRLEHPNEILRIEKPVSTKYEITAYCSRASRIGDPVLLFENVEDHGMPIVTNLFATRERVAMMIGTTAEKFRDVWRERVEAPISASASKSIEPRIVEDGPVKEVKLIEDDVNLFELPIPMHFEQDAGYYVTAGVTVANDPDTDVVNLSIARMQLKSRNRFGVSLHSRGNLYEYHRRAKEKGMPLDVAVFIGAHPSLLLGAASRKVDEYRLVSTLMGKPVELVKCETVDIYVPADAEIVLEGRIRTDIEEDEGPFSEFTGYVSGRSTRNVMEITAMTHRHDAMFLSISPSNFFEHILLGGIAKQAEIVRQMKEEFPQIVDINWPKWGTHFAAIIAVRNADKELVERIAKRLMSPEVDYYVKLAIVVDDDVDPFDEQDFLWAATTRMQADEDVTILQHQKGHFLDPSTREWGFTSKMIIDATKPEGWKFERGTVPKELLDAALENLKKLRSEGTKEKETKG